MQKEHYSILMFFGAFFPDPTTILDTLPAYLALVAVMFGSLWLGQRWGDNRCSTDRNTVKEWIGIIDGPILGLYGLLLAFTFYGAMQRFDERRRFVVEEATLLSTASRQLDRMASSDRQNIQALLYQYIDSRARSTAEGASQEKIRQSFAQSRQLQKKLWQEAQAGVDRPGAKPDAAALLTTLDQLINLLTRKSTIPQFHPPWQVMALFIFLAMVASFLAGFQISSLSSTSWPHVTLFILILALVTYLIIDLEYPYVGFIRMTEGPAVLQHLLETIRH